MTQQFDEIAPKGNAPVTVLSTATGVAEATREERDRLAAWIRQGRVDAVRATASMFGATTSATFPAATALAALALQRGRLPKPFDATGLETPAAVPPARIVVTSIGIWRGEGMALIEAVG
jgi:3-oxoacyl-[acyl-carrier-protein] synthase II